MQKAIKDTDFLVLKCENLVDSHHFAQTRVFF